MGALKLLLGLTGLAKRGFNGEFALLAPGLRGASLWAFPSLEVWRKNRGSSMIGFVA